MRVLQEVNGFFELHFDVFSSEVVFKVGGVAGEGSFEVQRRDEFVLECFVDDVEGEGRGEASSGYFSERGRYGFFLGREGDI